MQSILSIQMLQSGVILTCFVLLKEILNCIENVVLGQANPANCAVMHVESDWSRINLSFHDKSVAVSKDVPPFFT